MPKDEIDAKILDRVADDRRGFVRKAVLGTAFVAPFISSFTMDGLSIGMARAGLETNSTTF